MRAAAASQTETVQGLVVECLDLMETSGPSAVEELLGRHPEHARLVRARLERLQVAGLLEGPPGTAPRFPERLGPFRLIERLGSGGMGVVYLAEQEPLGRHVALKLVRPDLLYFEGARERFRREVEAAGRLSHPGIVPVYTVGEEEGIPFYAMEYVAGRSLDDVLGELRGRRPDCLTGRDLLRAVRETPGEDDAASEIARALAGSSWVDACVRVVLQVALVLDHAHRRGVLHRDVKPSNVMLAPDGRALLLDFGLASTRGTTKLTRTGSQMGSLPYMAPEQLRGEELDERTDLYGLGVTLYELLALRLPYLARDPEQTRRRILEGLPPPIRSENAAVPWDVETVCLKVMERDRGRRYRSAGALVEDLRAVLERRPIAASRPGPLLRARRFAQRNPTACTGVALGALLVIGSVGFGLRERATSRALRLAGRTQVELVRDLRAASAAKDDALRDLGRALRSATEAEKRALEELAASEAMLAFLNEDLLRSASPKQLGRDVSVREALDAAAAGVAGRFADRPLVEVAVRTTLGETYLDLGRPEEAEHELRRARELVLAAGAEQRPVALKNLAALADLTFEQSRTDEALELYARVLDGRRATLGRDHPDTLVTQSNLGGMLAVTGLAEEGEPLLAEAVRELRRVLGDADPRTISALVNHATALRHSGRVDEAVSLVRRAFELGRVHLGEGNAHTLMALNNLGATLTGAGRGDEALDGLQDALEGAGRALGWHHAHTLAIAESLAATYLELGRLDEAERSLEDAFARAEAAGVDPEDGHLGALHSRWGTVLLRRGRPAEAEAAYARGHAAFTRLRGPEHPDTLRVLGSRALALMACGRHAEAEPLLARAIEADREGGRMLFSRRLERADCLRETGRFEEAEAELTRAARMAADDPDPWARATVLERLGVLDAAWGRATDPDGWWDGLPASR